jgi:hypothetical protein
MLPAQVRTAVIRSLQERVSEHGLEYVLPCALRDLVDGQNQARSLGSLTFCRPSGRDPKGVIRCARSAR